MNDITRKLAAGAFAGFVAAFATDYSAFKQFKKWTDFKDYDWGIASFRWVQGAVLGVGTAFGLAQL
jgi:hypothetical protein